MKTKSGKAFNGWTRFFFVLACIAFSVLIVSFFSSVLIFLVGLFSTIVWGFFIVISLYKDKTHKKFYFSHIITMVVLSVICIPFAIMSLVMYYTK